MLPTFISRDNLATVAHFLRRDVPRQPQSEAWENRSLASPMGNYYALELFRGGERQIFFSEKGLPPAEFLTVFRPCDRAYPEFTSGFEDSDVPYIPSLA